MEILDKLPITQEGKDAILLSINNYMRFARVAVRLCSFQDNVLTVHIEQQQIINNKILTTEELKQRAENVFKDILPDSVVLVVNTKALEKPKQSLPPKFEIIQTDSGLVFRRNTKPVFEAHICKGEGLYSFELKGVVYHLKSDFEGNPDKLRNAASKAKSIIIQKGLWKELSKLQ